MLIEIEIELDEIILSQVYKRKMLMEIRVFRIVFYFTALCRWI